MTDIAVPPGYCISPEQIVTRARQIDRYLSDVSGCFNYRIGSPKSRVCARLYMKSKLTYRVEFSLRRRFFREFGVTDLSTLRRRSSGVWRYLTEEFLMVTEDRQRRKPSPFWQIVQGAAQDFRRFHYCDARKTFRARRKPTSPLISEKQRLALLAVLEKGPSEATLPLWARLLFSSGYNRKTISILTRVSERTVSNWLRNPSDSRRGRGRRFAYKECFESLKRHLQNQIDAGTPRNRWRVLPPCGGIPRATLYRYRKRILSMFGPGARAAPPTLGTNFETPALDHRCLGGILPTTPSSDSITPTKPNVLEATPPTKSLEGGDEKLKRFARVNKLPELLRQAFEMTLVMGEWFLVEPANQDEETVRTMGIIGLRPLDPRHVRQIILKGNDPLQPEAYQLTPTASTGGLTP